MKDFILISRSLQTAVRAVYTVLKIMFKSQKYLFFLEHNVEQYGRTGKNTNG